MATTSIEWTDETWNPVSGCTRASDGCDNCYAVTMTHRLEAMGQAKYAGLTVVNAKGDRHFNGVVRTHDDALTIPLRWKKPRRIFVNSMSDLFHRSVPFDFIDKVFVVMALTPQHTYQVLTKRADRMAEYMASVEMPFADSRLASAMQQQNANAHPVILGDRFKHPMPSDVAWPLPNVWLGTSVENQQAADERIPHLLRVPAVRFLSVEPLLGAVDLRNPYFGLFPERQVGLDTYDMPGGEPDDDFFHREPAPQIHWVIVGGESGPGARHSYVARIRSIVRQCKAASVPVFVKQLGSNPVFGRPPACPDCNGTGQEQIPCDPDEDRCEFCGGTGTLGGFVPPIKLRDPKGGDPSEWPEDLRVRQMPPERRT